MKKLVLILLLGGFIMTGAFAKTAFVYFSATGTTERMAKNAAKEMGADIFEIQPVHKYTDADLDWHDKKSLSTFECNDPKCRPVIKAVVSTLRQGSGTAGQQVLSISQTTTPLWFATLSGGHMLQKLFTPL